MEEEQGEDLNPSVGHPCSLHQLAWVEEVALDYVALEGSWPRGLKGC